MPPNSWICLQSPDAITNASSVTLSLDNRGLAYGDGFFTTMGVIDGLILWSAYHHQRLISHAKALQLDLDSDALLTTLQIHAKRLQQGVLKLIVTRAVQEGRGYGYTPSASGSACEVWLKCSAMTVATTKQLRLSSGTPIPIQPASAAICLSSQIACLPPPLAGLKSLNRLDTVLASAELQQIKAHFLQSKSLESNAEPNIGEGLLRDVSGNWVEGTMSNVFYQLSQPKNIVNVNKADFNSLTTGQWYTPSIAKSGVAGVMRQVIIDVLSGTKQPVVVRPLQDEDLLNVKQLFFCNALRGIMPMSSLTLLSGEVVEF